MAAATVTYDPHNLVSHTVRAKHKAVYETLRCEVGSTPSVWSAYLAWNWYHRWPEGNRLHGRCLNCGKTLSEVRVKRRVFIPHKPYEPPLGSAAHLERALEGN